MIPKKIRPYLKIEREKRTRGEERIDGRMVCCGNRAFEVFAEGKIRRGVFSGMRLFPENENIALEVGCKVCGKRIPIFDSRCNEYDSCDWNAGGRDEMISAGHCGEYELSGNDARNSGASEKDSTVCDKRRGVYDSNDSGDGDVFCDSRCGENEPSGEIARPAFRRVVCNRCGGDAFSAAIRYEYSNDEALEIAEPENAFTWIWVALECRGCGMKYRNFIDFETA